MEVSLQKLQHSTEVLKLPDVQRLKQLPHSQYADFQLIKSIATIPQSEYQQAFQPSFNNPNGLAEVKASLTKDRLLTRSGQGINAELSGRHLAQLSKLTPSEWIRSSKELSEETAKTRNKMQHLREEAELTKLTNQRSTLNAREITEKRIGQRIESVNYWREEIKTELTKLGKQSEELEDIWRKADLGIQELQKPAKILEEIYFRRNMRQSTENTYDTSDRLILETVQALKQTEDRLRKNVSKLRNQISLNRACQHDLELDAKDKFSAIQLDQLAQSLTNNSTMRSGVLGAGHVDQLNSDLQSWREFTEANLRTAKAQRDTSRAIISSMQMELGEICKDIRQRWVDIHKEMEHKIAQIEETSKSLDAELFAVMREVDYASRSVAETKRELLDQDKLLMLAESRLNTRNQRLNVELCRDNAHLSIMADIKEIRAAMVTTQSHLFTSQRQLQDMLQRRTVLQNALKQKRLAVDLEKEICRELASEFPISNIYTGMMLFTPVRG